MPATFSIRDATPHDWPTIVDYNLRLAEETEGKLLNRETLTAGVRAVLDQSAHGRYFLACHDDRVIGQTMITYEWSDWRNGQIWWIQSVYVEPGSRRQGVFRGLFEHIRQLAEATPGIIGLRLYVEDQNLPAHETYRSLGMAAPGYFVLERMFAKPQPE
ncbi:MAG: N-acetyltransferase family protein [Pirellulales bacterium]